jgi:hypothetical protein
MTSNGSSRREVTTSGGRGTTGYRAPELVKTSHYTNKVDIFAIGCIFFELFTNGEKAFRDDYEAAQNEIESRFEADPQLQTMFTTVGRTLLDRTLNGDPSERPTAKQLCDDFASQRWTELAFECQRLGNYELVIEGFQMAIQHSKVESIIWKELGDAYHAEGAFDDANAAYCTAISCGYSSDAALMTTIEETIALAAIERSFDSTEHLVPDPQEGQIQLQTMARLEMQREYRRIRRRHRDNPIRRWGAGVGFACMIWFLAP